MISLTAPPSGRFTCVHVQDPVEYVGRAVPVCLYRWRDRCSATIESHEDLLILLCQALHELNTDRGILGGNK